jgi:Uma2 family endonuclease
MGRAYKILPNYTYDDYCQWEGKWEVIEGIPHAMSPSPSLRHQLIASRLNIILGNAIAVEGCLTCEVLQPIDIKISDNTVVQPDLSLLCSETDKPYLDFPPILIVEILSPSTRQKDLITKYDLYCTFGVKYYVVVDPDHKSLEVHREDAGKYVKVEPPYTFELTDQCQIAPDFGELFR